MAEAYFKSFVLPDLHCPFPVTYHKHGDEIAAASDHWFENLCREFAEDKRRRLHGLKAGLLAAYCYNGAEDHRLQVTCDFLNFLFHIDDLSDELKARDTVILSDIVMNALASPHSYRRTLPDGRELPEDEPEASKLTRDYWSRCIRDAVPGLQVRFSRNMAQFLKAVESEAISRDGNSLPSVETFMVLRRDNTGCRPCFDLIEYALGIDLPDFVVNDSVFQTIGDCANDFIGLSNDLFSYNIERSRGDIYNIVVIVMKAYDLDLQGAIDYVGAMCHETMDKYLENKARLPSWGPQIDSAVREYTQGLEDWMSGCLHWSFVSERYFGQKGDQILATGLVEPLTLGRVRTNVA